MRFFDYLGSQPARSFHGQVKIVHLKPQHDTVSKRSRVGVDEIGIFRVLSVELKNQATGEQNSIVYVARGILETANDPQKA